MPRTEEVSASVMPPTKLLTNEPTTPTGTPPSSGTEMLRSVSTRTGAELIRVILMIEVAMAVCWPLVALELLASVTLKVTVRAGLIPFTVGSLLVLLNCTARNNDWVIVTDALELRLTNRSLPLCPLRLLSTVPITISAAPVS